MNHLITFVIKYDPIGRTARFSVHSADGIVANIADGEDLKDYENKDGLFTLEGQQDKIFKYLSENFDGEEAVVIELMVSQIGYEKYKMEFDRFEKSVSNYNRRHSIQVQVNVYVLNPVAPVGASTQSEAIAVQRTNVAVVGKIGSGKTELIKAICGYEETSCGARTGDGITAYSNRNTDSSWYEVDGIEIKKHNFDRTHLILSRLMNENEITVLLYCFRFRTGKIEDSERDFIVALKHEYPKLKILAVVTECIDEAAAHAFGERICRSTKQTMAYPVLAKELKCKAGYIQPFGLEGLVKEIYRGDC